MTTHELIAALRRGAPVTPKMSGRIVERLVAGEWAMRSLADALDKHKGGKLTLTKDETGYVDGALEECERLKEAVRWERECRETFAWLNNTLANIRADLEIHRSLIAARMAVGELL